MPPPGEAASGPEATARIAVIDDEPGIVDVLTMALGLEGFAVESAADVAGGFELVRRAMPDLVILDVGLPDGSGFDLLHRIRAMSPVPVLMLTARDDLEDRVRGLDLGADDYVAKPFRVEELVARVRAQLRRQGLTAVDTVLALSDLRVDSAAREVYRSSRRIELTTREFELLELFLRHPNQVLSKETILDRLWGYAFDDNLVEVYIGYLRRKLGEPPLIQTIRGAGYVLRERDEVGGG